MIDVLFVVLIILFFAACFAIIHFFDGLSRGE